MRKLIFLLFIYIAFNLSVSANQTAPNLILYNGKVFTSDAAQPTAEAIAIRSEHILAVGGNAEIKKLADAKTRLIDLQGKTVIPGINDAHFH
ncbi:MAG: amidohydrolase, partial [Pyrinomonadaceae bacterium]